MGSKKATPVGMKMRILLSTIKSLENMTKFGALHVESLNHQSNLKNESHEFLLGVTHECIQEFEINEREL